VAIVLSAPLQFVDSDHPFDLQIEEGQTTQWPQDTKGVIRIYKLKRDRQHNGHIVLSVPLQFVDSDYPFGIFKLSFYLHNNMLYFLLGESTY
jgi:hypothetical protein